MSSVKLSGMKVTTALVAVPVWFGMVVDPGCTEELFSPGVCDDFLSDTGKLTYNPKMQRPPPEVQAKGKK